jgi:signal transduction histidine kinase
LPCEPGGGPETDSQIQELTDALAMRDSFIGLVGHELRNSIAPMLLLAEQFEALARDPAAPPKVSSRAAMVTRALSKLVTTVDRVSEVADLRRGQLHLEPSPIDLAVVVEEICDNLGREAAAGGATFVREVTGSTIGQWDRIRVKQIAANLVSNAIRHGGGGQIEIGIHGFDHDVELVVRDHGPGIDPAAVARLFDRFDHERSRRVGGLGVGLWVVKTLCTAMRGSVTVENASTGGARFCVVLPRG